MREKTQLRRELLEKRLNIHDKSQKDLTIFKNLITLNEFQQSKLILTYVSTDLEVDTRALIDYCLKRKIEIAVPGIVGDEMKFFRLEKCWEIGESIVNGLTHSACIIPGLAFNKDNRRLGYGGGYYDRFLRNYNGIKIGLCYKEFMIDIPTESHDEQVNNVITDIVY